MYETQRIDAKICSKPKRPLIFCVKFQKVNQIFASDKLLSFSCGMTGGTMS